MTDRLLAVAGATKGFLPDDEAEALHLAALAADGPFLEVGSYCGRSAVWLGAAARGRATVLFAVDHHRGSEENQAGWEWHDPELVDPATGRIDTLPFLRRTLCDAGLEDAVIPVGGTLAIHDVFPDPADGGRPPYDLYRRCLASGAWSDVSVTGSLRVLRRSGSG